MKVYLFQGQGAQGKGMGAGLFDEFQELTREADEILGYSIKELCLEDADGRLPQTLFSQPAVYVVNAFTYFKKIRSCPKPDVVLGHSVGEYNALLASGVFDFQQGLKLVKKRGELLSTVKDGAMAAVMGLSEDRAGEILEKDHVNNLYIANYNSPYQIVIAGLKKDIQQAESLFMDNGAAHYRLLNVHSASHTPFMADIKKKFRNYVNRFKFGEISINIIANFTARPYKQDEIKDNMAEQLTSPVRWTESIRYLLAKGFDIDDFYEIGVSEVSVVKALAVRTCNEAGPLDRRILEREEKQGTRDVTASEFQREKYFPDLEAIIISLFNRKPYDRQPKYIAHTGCGDGTLLRKIVDIIKNKSLRGRVLDDFPVMPIGIDWNDKALADTARTLKNIDHLVLKSDINDPVQVISDLKEVGLRDPENILHIPGALMEQDLVEHFKRWSSVIDGHGLVIPGVHGLEPEISGQFIHQSESPWDDAFDRSSKGLLVEADRFLMAAAEAGLFPDPGFFKKYPKTQPFTRFTLNRFQRRNYRVRFAQEKDLPVLAQLEKQCWEPALQSSIPVIKKRLKRCPTGQLVLEMFDHNSVVGVIYSQRVANPDVVKNTSHKMLESLHRNDGPVVQLLCLNILPEMQYLNLGDQLLEFMLQRCTLMNGIGTIAGVTRFKDYYKHPNLSPQEYMCLRDDRERLKDPTLRFHQLHGVQVKGLVPNYRPQDKKNKGYGVFIQYDPFHRQRREIDIETRDRAQEHRVKVKKAETTPTFQSINDFIEKTIISILGKTGESGFSLQRPLMEMGLDSAHLLELGEKVRYQYQIKLEADFFFKYNTPARIISYLQENMDLEEEGVVSGEQKITAAAQKPIHGDKDIAIIGAACRLPNGIRGKEQLWEFLIKGKDAVCKLPGQRWNWPANIAPDNEHTGIDSGGFLDDIATFDASFFRISPKEAELMDPQQRILLELSWECLEDAGYPAKALAGSSTGVFIGASGSDYHILLDRHLKEIDAQLGIGTSMSVLPNRISYFYDLRGPSLQMDTACSASLAAVHEAAQSIQAGKCQQALVGGVHIMCHSANSIAYYKAGMLSKQGKCKTFDKDADGYVRGEGAVMLLLKPLSLALDSGDNIYAVLKGAAINHGGQASGLTVPNPSQQAALLIDAYQTAGLEPETVGYIEAHGTGTPLGDPIEISGLKEAFSRLANTKKITHKPFCGLGSIKTNIGHLEAAAGLAGLLKVVLALQHQTLPASLNFNELNPHITLAETPFYIVDKNQPWPLPEGESLRRAGVSSFGSGGTNVHLVLEQAPAGYLPSATRVALFEKTHCFPHWTRHFPHKHLICLSARTEEALRQKQQDMLTWLEKQGKQHHLADISAALLMGREHFDCRAALVVRNKQELQEKLKEVLEKGQTRDYFKENHLRKRQPKQPVFEEFGRGILKELQPGKKMNRREYENKLMALAELYARGYDLQWQTLYGLNRAPGINLPAYPFAGNRYWIPGLDSDTSMPAPCRVQQISTGQVKNRTGELGVDELMLLPRWEEQSLKNPGKPHAPHKVLMVYAGSDNRLVKTILDYYRQNQITKKIIQIRLSHRTKQISKEERLEEWQCDINDPGGFAACLQQYDSIACTYFLPGYQDENRPADFFDAVTDSQQENEIQLLRLVKFLQKSGKIDGNMDCFIITRDNYPMADAPVNPYGGGISGIAIAVAQRDHRFLVRSIDISTRDLAMQRQRNALLRLILDERSSERGEVIKFNNGSRYKRVFLKPEGIRFTNQPGLKKQGVYVILGGSGAVGGIITRYLIQQYQAKVAWIGRKPEMSPHIQKKIAALRGYGEPPLYIQADALCPEQMKQAVSVIKSHYSTIDGAMFSGVVYNFANSINQTTEREFQEVIDVKTKGSINFYVALQEEPLDFMCYFSSLHAFSFTGSANFTAYTAGITFTDGFVHFIGKKSRFPVGIINWGLWKSSLGESIDEKIINRKSSFLEDREGFVCFEHFTRLLRSGVLNQVLCLRASQPVRQLMNGKEQQVFQPINREKENQEPVLQPIQSVAEPEDIEEHIETIILDHLAKSIKISKTEIDGDVAFSDYGVDSIIGAYFVKQLNKDLNVNINPSVLFDYTTVNRLSCCILETYRQQKVKPPLPNPLSTETKNARRAIKSFDQTFSKVWPPAGPPEATNPTGIAVIGMAGQFPGAADIDTFWRNLVRGHDAVRELPTTYLDQKQRAGDKKQAGNTVYKWGGILENRDYFDPLFFNISPREAESMNPHQRLILQESWKALEDAGYNPRALAGTPAGMFIGAEPTGYDFETFTGYSDALIASRLSYYLNLHGPALVVNTGCSSSGAALHLACESLRHGESSLALAGGVFAMLEQSLLGKLAKHGMLSPAGRCRVFDESADGMVFSEGVGVVVLKRLTDAIAAGDHIYGVITASGMNQDGASNGITAPNGLAQEQLITGVYQRYGINPGEITFIEANGTGTNLGDTVEANSLVRSFRQFTPEKHYCALGSVDAHIGHTAAATGVIGLIKILLSFRHHQLPGLLHFNTINPLIELKESAFYVNTHLSGWASKNGRPLMAALNSFGHSGTNVHLVVREFLPPGETASSAPVPMIVSENTPVLIPLSARNKNRLQEYAGKLLDFLKRSIPDNAAPSIRQEDSRESLNTLEQDICSLLSGILQVKEEEIDLEEKFQDYGVEANHIGRLRERLQEEFRIEIPFQELFERDSIASLARYLEGYHSTSREEAPVSSGTEEISKGISQAMGDSKVNPAALAYTLQTGREAMEERVVFLVEDIPGLIAKLEDFAQSGEETDNCWCGSIQPGKDISALFYSDKELSHAIERWISKGRLKKIAPLWARGFDMNWELLYGENKPRRISLPTYPFAGQRYWTPFSEAKIGHGPAALSKPSPSAGKEFTLNPGKSTQENTRDYMLGFFSRELKLARHQIQLNKDPRAYGADSITFMKLIRGIETDFQTKITVREIVEHPTIQSLSTHLTQKIGNPNHPGTKPAVNIEPGTTPRDISAPILPGKSPLSEGQKGLWMLQKMVPGMSAYNVPLCFRIGRGLDIEKFKQACGFLLQQYPILTTVIEEEQGIPFQIHQPLQPLAFQREDISALPDGEIPVYLKKKAREPFSLEHGRLMRINLFSRWEQEHYLLICIHHIVFDGVSLLPFITTLLNTYQDLVQGKNPVPTPCSAGYHDFVRWEQEMLESREGEEHLAYWKQQLSGPLPVLELPIDHPRPCSRVFEGQTHTRVLSPGLSRQVKSFAQSQQVSLAMVFLGIFKVLLHRYTGQDEIITGMPTMGRPQERFDSMIGYFINMIPVRSQGIGRHSFTALLQELQLTAAEGLDHAVYPFPAVVRQLNLPRKPGTPPVFQVTFAYQNFLQSRGLQHFLDQYQSVLPLEFLEEINQEGEYDLELEVFAREEEFLLKMKFNPGLFTDATITRMMGYYVRLTGEISRNPGLTPGQYSFLSEEEQKTILADWNSNHADYPTDRCIHVLFDRQARETPHAIAVVNEEECLTYQELARKSTGAAIHLQSRGVSPDTIVGIAIERSIEMIIGILGILKAGGAYLPIDPDYPEERKKYMLMDSNSSILLTQVDIKSSPSTLIRQVRPANLAYLIYTSGSTGKPKGTAVPHQALVNFVYSMSANYDNDFSPVDNCLNSTNFCFDVSVCEIFMNLVSGACIVIFPREKAFDPRDLAKAIVKRSITFAYLPPGLLKDVFENLKSYQGRLELNKLLVGVEPIKDYVLQDFLTLNPSMQIVNGYGPTEATICATAYRYYSRKPEGKRVPIGIPLANNTVVLLDNYNHLVPVGVPGELCIAGDGLSKGYLNMPELTAEKFCLRRPGGLFSRKLPPWTPRKSFLLVGRCLARINGFYRSSRFYIIYKTGDMARWLLDGNLEFIGRLDSQVKIRGFRIELSEIESQLNSHW